MVGVGVRLLQLRLGCVQHVHQVRELLLQLVGVVVRLLVRLRGLQGLQQRHQRELLLQLRLRGLQDLQQAHLRLLLLLLLSLLLLLVLLIQVQQGLHQGWVGCGACICTLCTPTPTP